MIIGVDAGCLGIRDERLKVGVYHMAKSLFEELGKLDTKNTYLLYSFYPIEKRLMKSFGPNVKNVVVKPVRGWTKIWLPLQLLKDKPDIFLGLNQSLPLKLPLQTYRSVVVIHDLMFETFPKMYPGSFRKLHKESKTAVQLADAIIVPSLATKKDVETYYKIPSEKISVAYEGIRTFETSKSSRLRSKSNPYFLFVGALKPQKNIPILLKAFNNIDKRLLRGARNDETIDLVIVGGDKWKDKEIDKVSKTFSDDVKAKIKFLGNVDDATLAELYKHALAFVSPSLSEGFGLPYVEALSFGIPVIGPKTGAVPEVVGNAGILIDPTHEKALQHAMEKMLDATFHSKLQKKAILQASKFSWEQFAQKVLDTIERAAQ